MMTSLEALADFLVHEARTMEKGTEAAKKDAKEQVPSERVKDAPALARELRWRVRLAEGYATDEDVSTRNLNKKRKAASNGDSASSSGAGGKRKRVSEDHQQEVFRNFKPRAWDAVEERPGEAIERTVKAKRVDVSSDAWKGRWVQDEVEEDADGEEVAVRSTRTVLVKARRTETGIERHRVERVVETWSWPAVDVANDEAMEVVVNGDG